MAVRSTGSRLRLGAAQARNVIASRAFALSVIFLFVAISIVGIALPQMPQDITGHPAAYNQWLSEFAYPRFGEATNLLAASGLFNVFHSPWLATTACLLVLSTAVCTIKRSRRRRHSSHSPTQEEAFYTTGDYHTVVDTPDKEVDDATRLAKLALRRSHYQVSSDASLGNTYIRAEKNRRFGFATYLTHFAIILFLAGFVVGHYAGFRVSDFVVAEGTLREVGYNTGLSLYLESFSDEYWPDGTPRKFASRVTLLKYGAAVKEDVIRVNHPLGFDGVNFYQSSFGPAADIQVQSENGDPIYNNAVALSQVLGSGAISRPLGGFELPGQGLTVYVIASAGNMDPVISEGDVRVEVYDSQSLAPLELAELSQGVAVNLEGLQFTYSGMRQYSGFQVVRDPGKSLIWVACGILLAGIVLTFNSPYRSLWVLTRPRTGGGSQTLLRFASRPKFGGQAEVERLTVALTKSPTTPPDDNTTKESDDAQF